MENSPYIEINNGTIHAPGLRRGRYPILSNINLRVYPGELVYLIGKVGTGKSTLLKTLYGEVPLSGGSGQIAGYRLGGLKRRQVPFLRRRLGMVFQDFQLLTDRNIYSNMLFVLKATGWKNPVAMYERIDEILSMVGLTKKYKKYPHQLSGGEQQRLAVGRAFLNHPEIILADEPTGNLDWETSQEIMALFTDITNLGCSVLLATHNISIIENNPSRILRFSGGSIEEIEYEAVFGGQSKEFRGGNYKTQVNNNYNYMGGGPIKATDNNGANNSYYNFNNNFDSSNNNLDSSNNNLDSSNNNSNIDNNSSNHIPPPQSYINPYSLGSLFAEEPTEEQQYSNSEKYDGNY